MSKLPAKAVVAQNSTTASASDSMVRAVLPRLRPRLASAMAGSDTALARRRAPGFGARPSV